MQRSGEAVAVGLQRQEIFTIGHSNHSLERVIELLQLYQITAVADVRSHPYSRRLPQFCQAPLKAGLQEVGIQYVFLGKELGARPEDPHCYLADGMALYDLIAATDLFHEGIQRLIRGTTLYRIALLCAEKDPLTCHRSILVCRHLQRHGLHIQHILADGSLESQTQLEDRLLAQFNSSKQKGKSAQGADQLSLFDLSSTDVLPASTPFLSLDEAYDQQGRAIAYVAPATVAV